MSATRRNPFLLLLTGTLVACGGGNTPSTAPSGNTAPAVSIKASGRAITSSTYLSSRGRLEVGVSDPDMGGSIKKVVYSIDNGSPTELAPSAAMTVQLPDLSGGAHEVTVEATDNVGAVTTVKAPFLVDAAAPSLGAITLNGQAAASTATLTVGDAALLSVSAQDTRGDAQNTAGPVTIRILEGGTLLKSVSGTSTTVDVTKASGNKDRTAGIVIFTVEAEDSVGFVTSRNISVTFNAAADNSAVTAPTFTWLSPASDYVQGGGKVTLRATATRNGQDLSNQIAYTATCGTIVGNIWSLGADCADGSKQSVTATVTDGGRSFSGPAKVITVDASDPTVQVTSPQQGQGFTQNPIKISVAGTDAVSGLDRILVEASANGKDFVQVGVITSASGDVTWAPMNGTYTLRATATDKTGRTSSTMVSGIKVQLTSNDATPPTVSFSPIPTGPQRATTTIVVSASDTGVDASGVAKVDLYDGGTLIESKTAGVGGKYTFSLDTTRLSDGTHALRAVAFDNAGLSSEAGDKLTVDNTAPIINWISPANGAVTGGKVTLNATTNEGKVTYTVDGDAITGATVEFKNDGAHTITAAAKDDAGNTTTSTITVTSDATAPTAQIISPTGGSTLTSNPVTVNVSGNDAGSGVANVEVLADGISIGTVNGASGSVTWAPASGSYALTVIATDKAGNRSIAGTPVTVEVKLAIADTSGPEFLAASPTIQPAPTNGNSRGSVIIDGLVKDAETGISQVALFNGGLRLNAPVSLSQQPDGSIRYALALDTRALNDGNYSLTIQATNGIGLVSNKEVTVQVNNSAPMVSITNPQNGALLGSASNLTVSATAADTSPDDDVKLTYSVDGGAFGDTATLPRTDSTHTLTVRATDKAGNIGSATSTFTYDGTAPIVQITSPTAGQKFIQNPVVINVSGTDNNGMDRIDVFDGETKIGTVNSGQGAVTWAASNGSHTLKAIGYDKAGNVTTSSEVQITLALTSSDTTAPTGTVTVPVDPKDSTKFLPLKGQAAITVNATDKADDKTPTVAPSGVATVRLYVDGLLNSTQTSGVNSNYTFPIDTTKLTDGAHSVTAVITDNAGNSSTTQAVTVQVNNSAPTVSITSPQNGALLNKFKIAATVSDVTPGDDKPEKLEYSMDGGEFTTDTTTLSANITDGTHTLTVRATDKAGNIGSATSTFTYDGTAPIVQITSPTTGQKFSTTPVSIGVVGQDSGTGIAKIEVEVYADDGTRELIGTSNGSGTVTWYPRKTDGTSYKIVAIATDRAGNSTETTIDKVQVQTASSITLVPAPTISVPNANPKGASFPADGRLYVRGPLNVAAKATTNAPSMAQAELQLDGQTRASNTTTPPTPTFTFDFDTLNEGLHDVGVRFTDSLGTVGSTKTSVFVDKTGPVITWNTPLSGSLSNKEVTPSASASDNASGFTGAVTFNENGTDITGPVGEGQHTIMAVAKDNLGNTSTKAITFTVDMTGPAVVPTSPTDNQEFASAPITLSASASDNLSGVAYVEAKVGVKGQPLTTLGRQNGPTYSAVYTPTQSGTYEVEYTAWDAAGNASSIIKRTFQYSVTTAPVEQAPKPVLEVIGSAPFSGNISVNVSGNFHTSSQIDRMILQVTDAKGVIDNSTYVTTQARATFSVDTTRFANGLLKLQVIAIAKSGLIGNSDVFEGGVQNLTSPDLKVATPSDGAIITTPTVPVQITLTKRSADYSVTGSNIVVDVLDYRGVSVRSQTLSTNNPSICTGSAESLTCNTSFDIAALPADIYSIRVRANVQVDPSGVNITRALETTSRFTHNTASLLPPAASIRFPAITDLQKPSQLDSSSGVLISVSDNTGVSVVEARIVGPFDGTQPLTLNGTTQCDASVPVAGRSPVDVLMLNYGYSPPITNSDVVLRNLDIDGSAYIPNNNPNERYDLRVTVQDTEGNRNIQCIPVTVNRTASQAARAAYVVSTAKLPNPPSTTPGELNYTTGTWRISGMTNSSRVAAVLYQDNVQKTVTFESGVTTFKDVTVSFGDPGTYQIVWLIEDMTTGVVTSVSGEVISVVKIPTP